MLQRSDLWSLEEYSENRLEFRTKVLEHKRNRRVRLGEHVLLLFEDALTIRYQVQEMLRIERIFEAAGIQEELDAYNPLIPDGENFKCSMLIQYADVEERKTRLKELVGIEGKVWLRIGDGEKIYPIADEDLERTKEDKTAAVHFLRYQLAGDDLAAARSGAPLTFGIEHPNYPCDDVTVSDEVRQSLAADLSS